MPDWASIKESELKVGDEVRVGHNFVKVIEVRKRPQGIWFYWRDGDKTFHTGCPTGGSVIVKKRIHI